MPVRRTAGIVKVPDAGPARAIDPVQGPASESLRRTNPRESDEALSGAYLSFRHSIATETLGALAVEIRSAGREVLDQGREVLGTAV
jgi:hypothetical protein